MKGNNFSTITITVSENNIHAVIVDILFVNDPGEDTSTVVGRPPKLPDRRRFETNEA